MDVDEFFRYLGYMKNVIEFLTVLAPFVSGLFCAVKKKLHKQ